MAVYYPQLEGALTYDDVQLVPQYSEIASRSDISLTTRYTRNYKLDAPYMASCMDTICERVMAITMMSLGATGCIHRFMTIKQQCDQVAHIARMQDPVVRMPITAAIGASEADIKRGMELIDAGANVLLIDVAHGNHINVVQTLRDLREYATVKRVDIIAGSVADGAGALRLAEAGADAIRVGIGNGSLCTTRIQTGHGLPSITSILDAVRALDDEGFDIPVIADGGLRSSGDIAKALAFGASSVMLGSLIAGTKETPTPYIDKGNDGLWKAYRGSASLATKTAHGMKSSHVEGESTLVRDKGGVKYIIEKLNDGLRSALSYTGSPTIKNFQERAIAVQVTPAGQVEARPHLLG